MTGGPGNSKSNSHRHVSGGEAHPGLIQGWREKALDWILRGIFIFTTPVLVLGLINLVQDFRLGMPTSQAFFMGVLYVAVYFYMVLITFGKRFGYPLRVASLLFILTCVATADLIAGGLSSDGLLIIFAVIALAAVFLDMRKTLVVQAAGIGLILGVAWLLVSGRIVIALELQANSSNLASWLVRGLVFALLSTGLVLSTTYLVRCLEQSLVSARKQTDQLAAMQDVALDILAHTSMKELLEAIVCRAAGLLAAAGGLVFLADAKSGKLVLAGICGPGQDSLRTELRPGEGVAGKVFISQSPLIVRDLDRWDRNMNSFPKGVWGSVIQVPIWHVEDVIGVLGCYTLSGDLREFDQDDLLTLERLARQVSVALESVHLIEALRQAESRLDAIVQTAPLAIVSMDLDQQIVTFNQAAEEMFFCKAEQVIGQPINTLIPERYHRSHQKFVESFIRSSKGRVSWVVPRELTARRLTGEEFPVEITLDRVEDEGGLFLIAILRDITLTKQAQKVIEENETLSRVLLEFSKNLELSQTHQAVIESALEVTQQTLG
ncbi:MAG: PAS domain S-box protein, partial [Chloroflexota bacterium]